MGFKRTIDGLEWMCHPIAHRGLHDKSKGIVENTPSSVQAALDKNYAIEVDLQPAQGNVPIVFHDPVFERLTTSSGLVRECSLQDLKRICFKESQDRIATLSELLEQVDGKTPIFLEVKSDWKGDASFIRSIVETVKDYSGDLAVMSFNPVYIGALAELAPNIPRGLVSERFRDLEYWSDLTPWRRFAFRHLLSSRIAKPHFIAYDIEGLPSAAPLIARNLYGTRLLTWTVRTPVQRTRAEKWADAMIFEGFCP